MKRTKSEQLQSSVSQYLKRRQFSDSDTSHKKECKGILALQEMALKSSMKGEATTDNTFTYCSIAGDAHICEQQFTRFKGFIQDAAETHQRELRGLLFPLFVHLYIELLCNGHKAPAHKFFSRHSGIFKNSEKHKELLENLSRLYSRTDVHNCKEVQEYRDLKYHIKLSQDALVYLNRYLKLEDNMITLQIFNQYLKLEVKTGNSLHLHVKEEKSPAGHQLVSPSCIPENKVVIDEQALLDLKQCIKDVRDGPPCLPSICFYTFLNAYQGLCCVKTSPDNQLLSAGFEDSLVKIWKLSPGMFQPQPSSTLPSMIYLAADYLSDGDDSGDCPPEREVAVLKGHTSTVYQTCFTWDSKYLLSCSEDTTVRLWNLETLQNSVCFRGHNYPVWDIDTSKLGDYFASCSHDQTAKLWCTERNYPLRSFIGHTYDVDSIQFHPNNNYLATGSGDKTVRLWSLQDGRSVRLFQGHKGSILALAFSPNGKYLASTGDDRRVRVWDLGSGALFKEFRGHTDTIHCLSFNKDSTVLASGGLDCCIRIWDIKKSSSSNISTSTEGHTSPELLGAFPTRSATVTYLNYVQYNLLQAAGAI